MHTWLVTGGAGFIGANLVRAALARTEARIVVLDRLTYAGHRESLAEVQAHPRFRFVWMDVADREAVAAAYRAWEPSVVLHLAAETHVDRSIDDAREFVRTNVVGTHEMLEGARQWLATRPSAERAAFRFVLVSTDEVHGSLGPTGRFTEASPYDPRSPYAATKAGADHLAHAYHATYGLPTMLTNASNNYGPYQLPEKLVPLAALNALEGRPIPVYGDGGNVRDWMHVEDHCEGLLRAVASGRPGDRYLFGAEEERTTLEVVQAVCAAAERLLPASSNPALRARGVGAYQDLVALVPDRPGHDRRYAVDPSHARRALGWAPRRRFAEGIEATVRWYLEHRAWCDAVQHEGDTRRRRGLGSEGGAR